MDVQAPPPPVSPSPPPASPVPHSSPFSSSVQEEMDSYDFNEDMNFNEVENNILESESNPQEFLSDNISQSSFGSFGDRSTLYSQSISDFSEAGSQNIGEEDRIFVQVETVKLSQSKCFICKDKNGRSTVPREAAADLFLSRKILLPRDKVRYDFLFF